MLSRASLMIPRRALAMSRPNLGPKKKKKKAGGAGKVVEVKLPDPETDIKKLVTHCCGLNPHSEEILNMYEWTDEQKLTLFDEPQLKENSEYPDWLWAEDFLTDLSKVDINDLDPSTKIYWQKFEMLENEYRELYYSEDKFYEKDLPPLWKTEFISHFPDIEIKPRPKKLKNKIIKSAPYANQ